MWFKSGLATNRKFIFLIFASLVGVFSLVSCSLPALPAPIASEIPASPVVSASPTPSIQASQVSPTIAPVTAQPDGTAPTQATLTVTPTNASTLIVPASYQLEASLDFYRHVLSVSESITYTNYSSDDLAELVLVTEPNRWSGGFTLNSLTWQSGAVVDTYTLEDNQLHIPLSQPLPAGDQLGLNLVYQLILPGIPPPSDTERPIPYGYSSRQTNLVDWYPYFPPYQSDVGWVVHKHGWFGENQVLDVADFDVRLTLVEPVKDFVIAASAPAERDGDSYSYHLEAARNFVLSASDVYLVHSTRVGDVTVYSYSFPYDKEAAQQVLQDTAQAVELYSHLIIPYPHQSLSVVEADFLDGMEYDGLYFLSHGFYDLYDGTPKGYLTFIAAHETAHQWWYGLVGNDQALEPWLDEAICTYMEHIFYENVSTDEPSDSSQSLVDWWWYYRVNFYDPTGWVNGSIYDYSQFYAYRNAVYLNGAKFFDDLRNLVGDKGFFAFLRDYATQEMHHIATGSDFFAILRQHTSKDLSGLLETYFKPPD